MGVENPRPRRNQLTHSPLKPMKIESLRQRIGLLVLLPVGVLLFFVGILGFVFMRGTLFKEWEDTSIVKLQRAAHQVDMRLGGLNNWIHMFHHTSGSRGGPLIQQWILEQIRGLDGVTGAQLKWRNPEQSQRPMKRTARGMGGMRIMEFHRARITEVTPPIYNAETGDETVTLISLLKDKAGAAVGALEVSVSFQYLIKGIKAMDWWQTGQACLMDDTGKYLAHSEAIMKGRKRFGEADDPFELALLKAIAEKPYGIVLGPEKPPDQVGGFYRLALAPWTIVLFAPGNKILGPIIRLRNVYFVGGILAILCIFMLNQTVVEKMVRAFTAISRAAESVSKGRYGQPLPVYGYDEIAQLTQSFNTMVEGLKERDFVANTFGRYVDQEIAKKLMQLPEASRLGGENLKGVTGEVRLYAVETKMESKTTKISEGK